MGGLDIPIQRYFTFHADCIRVRYTALGWVNFLQTLAHQLGPSLAYLGFTCALVRSTVCPLVWRSVAPLIYLCGCALVSPLRIALYGGPQCALYKCIAFLGEPFYRYIVGVAITVYDLQAHKAP